MANERILIAGIGNIFLGDDAFGVEVAQRLALRPLPEGVRVVDYGIRGYDLAYALLDGYDATIMVDATPRGGQPGTLYVIDPEVEKLSTSNAQMVDAHSMHPLKVLQLVKSLGGEPRQVLVVGCEPATFGPEEGAMGLSDPVRIAVDEAVTLVESLVERLREEGRIGEQPT